MFQRRASSGPDPETASAVVAGAGTAEANGTYTRSGSFDGKPRYVSGGNEIAWNAGSVRWEMAIDGLGTGYESANDVAYPWLATWAVADGDSPAPTVTIGS